MLSECIRKRRQAYSTAHSSGQSAFLIRAIAVEATLQDVKVFGAEKESQKITVKDERSFKENNQRTDPNQKGLRDLLSKKTQPCITGNVTASKLLPSYNPFLAWVLASWLPHLASQDASAGFLETRSVTSLLRYLRSQNPSPRHLIQVITAKLLSHNVSLPSGPSPMQKF
ncbi:hypothetical protein AAG906_004616 [Vitis piasezkii]